MDTEPFYKRNRRPRTLMLAAGLVVVLGGALGLAALGGLGPSLGDVVAQTTISPSAAPATPAPSPTTVTMSGHIQMLRYDTDEDPAIRTTNWKTTAAGDCEGHNGYSDMTEGAEVTAYDANGQIVGTSSLEAGQRIGTRCSWAFSVMGLPPSPFYQVEVSHRGRVTVQRALVGLVELTLG